MYGPDVAIEQLKPAPVGAIEDTIGRVHHLANRLETAVIELSHLGIRLFVGERTTAGGGAGNTSGGDAPTRGGQLGALADAMDRLEMAVAGAESHASQLQRL